MNRIAIAILALALVAGIAGAQDKGFGFGFIAGEPSGLSLKYWLGPMVAADGALAWSFFENYNNSHGYMHLHADLLLHVDPIKVTHGKLPLYIGAGGVVRLQERNTRVGVRVPLGINYQFPIFPLDLFFELAPTGYLLPATGFGVHGGVGIRYFLE